jgi:hypothetical protein
VGVVHEAIEDARRLGYEETNAHKDAKGKAN